MLKSSKRLKASLGNYFNRVWYQPPDTPPRPLKILSQAYQLAIGLRRHLYQIGLLKSTSLSVPVIVVGNLSVGGTGKTPLTLWVVNFLTQQGYHPAVISRGYGGNFASKSPIRMVTRDADPIECGDESVLIVARSGCPVAVGKSRVAAAQHLLSVSNCDIIVCDDGLQHLALKRDIEIIVIDGMRLFGNRYCLPAGPLREPVSRMKTVDLLVCNGGSYPNATNMVVKGDTIINLLDPDRQKPLSSLRNKSLHVITGIGNPQRFFNLLTTAGLIFDTRVFPDHHHFSIDDLYYDDDIPLLMTEKDAVKCYHLATKNYWMLPVDAQLDLKFSDSLSQLLENNDGRYKTT